MKLHTLERDGCKLIWIQIDEDKWEEQLWQRDKENGRMIHMHNVKYLTTKTMKDFIERLKEIGFVEV